MKALHIKVTGKVQRVGFRRYILDLAQELGLAGHVKNLPDGSVEVFAQGPQDILNSFLDRIKKSPPPVLIKNIQVREVSPKPEVKTFRIVFGELAEELQEGFGAMQSIFMEYWKEFREFRKEFRDFREEFRGEFRDFREEFREFRGEFRSFVKATNENFKLVMEKYGEISNKLTTILETLVKKSKETREILNETMKSLRKAIEKLGKT